MFKTLLQTCRLDIFGYQRLTDFLESLGWIYSWFLGGMGVRLECSSMCPNDRRAALRANLYKDCLIFFSEAFILQAALYIGRDEKLKK